MSAEPDFSAAGPVAYSPVEPHSAEAGGSPPTAAETQLLAIPGVVSVGIGSTPLGEVALVVGVTDAGVEARLPSRIGDFRVMVSIIGEVDASRPL